MLCFSLASESGVAHAQTIGTWNAEQSEAAFASSDAFDQARAVISAAIPRVQYLGVSRLNIEALGQAHVLILDSQLSRELGDDEIRALISWVEGGGTALVHVSGPVGRQLASAAGASWIDVYSGPEWVDHPLSEVDRTGPFGAPTVFRNRYESHLAATSCDCRVIAEDRVGPVLLEVDRGGGRLVLYTNLFAFADSDWSVGGSGDANAPLLLNLLFSSPSSAPGVHGDWVRASRRALDGADPEPVREFADRYADDAQAAGLVARARAWDPARTPDHDPRFFPVGPFALGVTTRKQLLQMDHAPTDLSKWTFDLGDIEVMCLAGRVDVCTTVKLGGSEPISLPPDWSAAGLSAEAGPRALNKIMRSLGYATSSSFAAVSPFGTQLIAEGYGLRWEFDYREVGESADNLLVGVTVREN